MSGFNATMPEMKNISINVMELTNFHNKTAILPCLNAKKAETLKHLLSYMQIFFVIELPPLFKHNLIRSLAVKCRLVFIFFIEIDGNALKRAFYGLMLTQEICQFSYKVA